MNAFWTFTLLCCIDVLHTANWRAGEGFESGAVIFLGSLQPSVEGVRFVGPVAASLFSRSLHFSLFSVHWPFASLLWRLSTRFHLYKHGNLPKSEKRRARFGHWTQYCVSEPWIALNPNFFFENNVANSLLLSLSLVLELSEKAGRQLRLGKSHTLSISLLWPRSCKMRSSIP